MLMLTYSVLIYRDIENSRNSPFGMFSALRGWESRVKWVLAGQEGCRQFKDRRKGVLLSVQFYCADVVCIINCTSIDWLSF
jgi:hypothetical protein